MNLIKRFGKRKVILFLSIIAILVVGVVVIASLPSGAKAQDLSAHLSEMVGVVEVRNDTQAPYNPVNNGFLLKSVMQLQTKEESRVRLDLSTGSIVRLSQLTIFSLQTNQTASGGLLSKIELQAGTVWVILKGGGVDVNTPAGLASVRGSYMSVTVFPATNTITVTCLEGSCGYTNKAGDVDMTSGQQVTSSDQNVAPTVQKMDQSEVQSWLTNNPEAAAIVTQIASLLPSVAPSATPTLTLGAATDTATATLTPDLSETPAAGSGTSLTPGLTQTAGGSITPTLLTTPESTPSFTPSASATTGATSTQVATKAPSATPIPPTLAPTRTLPRPTNTHVPPTQPGYPTPPPGGTTYP